MGTLAVAVITIVTGLAPQSNLMIPPAATARTTAADVQLAGLPSPITWSGWLVSTALPAGGTGKCPFGLPNPGTAVAGVAGCDVPTAARSRPPVAGAAVRAADHDSPAAAGGCPAAAGAPRAPEAIAAASPPAPATATSKIPKRRSRTAAMLGRPRSQRRAITARSPCP